MPHRYTLHKGKVSFPCKLAKEHWIIEGNIFGLKDVLKLDKKNLSPTQKELIKLSIRELSAMEKRMKKELIKQGYQYK
jgi:hypothetical protein